MRQPSVMQCYISYKTVLGIKFMKELREGVSTGSCMTGGAEASVIWQTTGKCPSVVKVETPIGKTLYLDIIPKEFGVCGVVKDAGDDPDVTNGSEIITKVELFEEEGDISFFGGDGVGTITQEGLKIPPGQPAINPVPRQMAEKQSAKLSAIKGKYNRKYSWWRRTCQKTLTRGLAL